MAAAPPDASRRFIGRSMLGLGVVLCAAAALLAVLLLAAGPLLALDHAIETGLNGVVAPRPGLVAALEVLAVPGETVIGWVILSTLTVALVARGQRRLAVFVLVTGLGAAVLGPGLKQVVGRLRPVVDVPVATAPGPSFPSGHALTVTVWVGVSLLVLLPTVPARARRPLVAAATVLVLLVGFTRLALGVHYLTDVLGGYLLGLGWLAVTTSAFHAWRHRIGLEVAPVTHGLTPEAAAQLTPAPDAPRGARPGWTAAARLLVAAVLLLGALCAVGWALTRTSPGAAVGQVDLTVARWFVAHRIPVLDPVSATAAELGGTTFMIGLGLVGAVLVLAVYRRWHPVLVIATALVGELVVFLATTAIVGRPRPPVPHLDPQLPPTSSFPSGHVAAAICGYGVLTAVVLGATRRWWRWPAVAVAAVIVCAIALARLYRGAHYLSDVLSSVAFGTAWLLVTLRLLTAPRMAQRPPRAVASPGQTSGTTSGAPIRAESAVSSSGIRWLSRSAATRLR